jgi:hypothetical protein
MSHERLQPLGFLMWAACGKDPGFGPASLLAEARRTGRYTQLELDELAFDGAVPDAAALGRRWHELLEEAHRIIELLPPTEVGRAVLSASGELYKGAPGHLGQDLSADRIRFHRGSIRGVWPTLRPV